MFAVEELADSAGPTCSLRSELASIRTVLSDVEMKAHSHTDSRGGGPSWVLVVSKDLFTADISSKLTERKQFGEIRDETGFVKF